jgi:hypothetical protein
MLHYPKIPGSRHCPDGRCVAFEKYDGTNLHWDWDRDFSWHAFGTRRDEFALTRIGIDQFENTHAHLRQSVEVFQAGLANEIESVFIDNANYREFTSIKVFTEFFGPNSFAGLHKSDDPKQLMIFDVLAEPFGIIGPEQLVTDFGHLSSARVVYRGKLTGKFSDDVRKGKYDVREGVVCKGGTGGPDVWMVKIKTHAYMEKLKAAFAEKWEDFWE